MTPRRRSTNTAASVRARLLDLARKKGVEFQLLLSEFAIERLLFRLGASPYVEQFVLKGATLFRLWSDERRRATWDLDLLGHGASGVEDVVNTISDSRRKSPGEAIGTRAACEMIQFRCVSGVKVEAGTNSQNARNSVGQVVH